MILHPIEQAVFNLPPSIWNTAKKYIEGRNILIKVVAKNAKRTEREVVEWLKQNKYEVKDLDKYRFYDDPGRIK